jgi:hypothetical protein
MNRPSVGDLWNGTIAVTHRNFANFAVIAAALVFLPALISRLMFPELLQMPVLPKEGTPPPTLPSGFWPYMIALYIAYVVGLFTIAAVSVDPNEGGGRTMGAIVKSTLPAIGKALLAGLVLMFAYLVFSIVLGIAVGILAVIIFAVSGGEMSSGGANLTAAFVTVAMVLVLFPLIIWVAARLSPLTGVYLAEDVGVFDGIKRAWALSSGSAGTIVLLVLLVGVITLAVALAQFALVSAGLVDGVVGLVSGIVLAATGALLFVYQAAGLGYLYRRLAMAETA